MEGTKVTVESFMAWKAAFDEERLSKKEIVDVKEKRLTGKELFLQNISLNESDLQFLTEGNKPFRNLVMLVYVICCAHN